MDDTRMLPLRPYSLPVTHGSISDFVVDPLVCMRRLWRTTAGLQHFKMVRSGSISFLAPSTIGGC